MTPGRRLSELRSGDDRSSDVMRVGWGTLERCGAVHDDAQLPAAIVLANSYPNVHVCYMYVSTQSQGEDPVVRAIAEALAPPDAELLAADTGATTPLGHLAGAQVALIVGPPGFGKSSVLAAAADLTARRTGAHVLPISGSIVASEGHLARLLVRAARAVDPHEAGYGIPVGAPSDRDADATWSLDTTCAALAASATPILLAVDDIDALVFKRERVAERLVDLVTSSAVRLVASCLPAAAERFLDPHRPFATALAIRGGQIASVVLAALEDQQARTLVRRRAPRLSEAVTAMVIDAAGGHPAALVFLSRLAEFWSTTAVGHATADPASAQAATRLGKLFDRAAEFAGAVYAESWSALGPQQRAVLWQLSATPGPTTAAEVAMAIDLPPSHVSAQLTRLVADGLVRRTGVRGHFVVAPLLASWIARRAAGAPGAHDQHRGHNFRVRASSTASTARDAGQVESGVDTPAGPPATVVGIANSAAADRARVRPRRSDRQTPPPPRPTPMPSHDSQATADGASMTHRSAVGRHRPKDSIPPAAPGTPECTPRAEEA